tara:strand:+ start:453 stop:2117 length:1665 start_codon:yes stop_codon:yes gene_type:complete
MVDNTEIWTGANAHLTLVPESNLMLGFASNTTNLASAVTAETSGTYSGLYKLDLGVLNTKSTSGTAVSGTMKLVTGLYAGCIADFYTHGNDLNHSLLVADNSDTEFYFHTDYANSALNNAAAYVVLRKFGTPIPGPITSANPTLLADNWLGLVNTATFPNVEIEMKQLNLAIGGSRNWTHQYKGPENATGANLDISANHGAWLYYALGQCSNIELGADGVGWNNGAATPTTAYTISAFGGDTYFLEAEGATGTGTFSSQGPFFYRAPAGIGSIHPPLVGGQHSDGTAIGSIDTLIAATQDGNNNIVAPIEYTFEETNGDLLPSFSLEHTLFKSGQSVPYQVDADDEVWTRIATGNTVNTLTMTANENEELKITVDMVTKAVYEAPANYRALGGKSFTSVDSLQNKSTVQDFLTPFMFYDGSISIFGQQYLKISSMSLTINNNLQEKRYVGNYDKKSKNIVPAQRDYELTFSGFVTDKTLFTQLLNEDEENTSAYIDLHFTKDNGEFIKLKFKDYYLTSNTWPIPEDKGPIQVDWTIKPRNLQECKVNTHWVLQG